MTDFYIRLVQRALELCSYESSILSYLFECLKKIQVNIYLIEFSKVRLKIETVRLLTSN